MGEVPYNEDFVYRTKHIPIGSRDQLVNNIPSVKHKDWTQNEVYGSQYDNQAYQKIYLQQLPQNIKEKEIQRSFRKSKKTSDSYGQFYSPRVDSKGRRQYDVDPALLPPSVPRLDNTYPISTNHAPSNPLQQAVNTVNVNSYPIYNRGSPMLRASPHVLPPIPSPSHHPGHISNRDPYSDGILRFTQVAAIDMNIKTADFASVNLYHTNHGYEHSCYPDGVRSVAVPDIKEVNIRLRNHDGTYTNITTVPKRYS